MSDTADLSGPSPVAPALLYTVAVPVPNVAADTLLVTGGCIFNGYSLLGNGGAATAEIYDGQDATGTLIAEFSAASGAVDHVGPVSDGVICRNGLFLHRLSGTIKGSVYVKLLP